MVVIQIARFLLFIGVVLLLLAGVIYVFAKLGIPWGGLPDDLRIENLKLVLDLHDENL